ncbi:MULTISPECIES: hypothetical protein [unclassified Rhizobium]|uniref:hypothetical protein n=1 Tax=unclassified Rhizobium TaxID=2613769 RepID=UPI000CDF42D8|nr:MULTISPECIES: hypothetical protein [Rhizobium]AVA23280.1 hypothetical protein NXC24_CH03667 [Rhizobium sp. NXC24]UWU20630.1 hypothetical protein N2601_15325 [Rhizobium tropici]
MLSLDEASDDDGERVSSKLRAAFPLSMRKDFEVPVNRSAYQVGVDKHYPARLREMISAAVLTYSLQNKSVDNIYRKYFKDKPYSEDPGGDARLDRLYRRSCREQTTCLDEILKWYPKLLTREPSIGEVIGDLTLIRVLYSFERAFSEADKGALFEAVAIARMILEQVSWVFAVHGLDDGEVIKKTKTTKSIATTTAKFPQVGRLYGWMSDHAHWSYGAHMKVIVEDDESATSALLASSEFKAIAYAMLIALTFLVSEIVASILGSYLALSSAEEFKSWNATRGAFDAASMIDKMYHLSGEAPDIGLILNIVKVDRKNG